MLVKEFNLGWNINELSQKDEQRLLILMELKHKGVKDHPTEVDVGKGRKIRYTPL